MTEQTEEDHSLDDWPRPAVVAAGLAFTMAFGPAIVARPFGPLRNFIGWRIFLPALLGTLLYALLAFQLLEAIGIELWGVPI